MNLPNKFLTTFLVTLTFFAASAFAGQARAATFSLSPVSGSNVNGTFTVTTNLTELLGKQVSGVDVYLNYEPSKLEAVSVGTSSSIFTATSRIDSATGKIFIGGSASAFSPVSAEGVIAVITFRTIATSGATTLSFDYSAGSTTDSNITEYNTATDILTQPPTVTYNIVQTSSSSSTTANSSTTNNTYNATSSTTNTATTTTSSQPKGGTGVPDGGSTEFTLLMLILSLFLMTIGGIVYKRRVHSLEPFETSVLKKL